MKTATEAKSLVCCKEKKDYCCKKMSKENYLSPNKDPKISVPCFEMKCRIFCFVLSAPPHMFYQTSLSCCPHFEID